MRSARRSPRARYSPLPSSCEAARLVACLWYDGGRAHGHLAAPIGIGFVTPCSIGGLRLGTAQRRGILELHLFHPQPVALEHLRDSQPRNSGVFAAEAHHAAIRNDRVDWLTIGIDDDVFHCAETHSGGCLDPHADDGRDPLRVHAGDSSIGLASTLLLRDLWRR